MFESQGSLDTVKEKTVAEPGDREKAGRTHVEWPPLRKTGRKLVTPEPRKPRSITPETDSGGSGKVNGSGNRMEQSS